MKAFPWMAWLGGTAVLVALLRYFLGTWPLAIIMGLMALWITRVFVEHATWKPGLEEDDDP